MREFKFRFWDGKGFRTDLYIYNGEIYDIYNDYGGMFSSGLTVNKIEAIAQQYTGLKDVNGVEIYEGDIVFSELNDKKYIIEWAKAYSGPQYCMMLDGEVDNFYGGITEDSVKVIGNIYEEKENNDR